jgi:hypothetical protein
MARKPTGNPHWKALAVKLPAPMIDEVRRYADLHGMSISEVIREGVDLRLHGTQQLNEYSGNTAIPAPTVTMLTRLATTLTTAVDQLRSVCAGSVVPEGEERQIPSKPQWYNSNTTSLVEEYNSNTREAESYNGNTLDPAPYTAPRPEPQAATQQSEVCPHFDRTKYLLGKLCKRGHEWGTTGRSLLSVHGHTCKECKAEHKRRKRAAEQAGGEPDV